MYEEKFRPQYHFSPKKNWMNDPNGLLFYKGEYHLFYQYHPYSKVWGPMHWGHAISKDLIHWEELPIAIYPDELGQIFSGSAVVDRENTSGLKNSDEDVLIAIFTHHGEDNEKQSIAYSNDKGRTWAKYKGNPVLKNPGIKDFRDPKVFWHNPSQKWIMTLAAGDCVHFYGSPNLLDWSFLSSFGKEYGAHGGVWECPDLIELEIEGEKAKKWVLIVSINPGGPNGGSAVQYFTGDFDGIAFAADTEKERMQWADHGRDFYAAVTWSNTQEPIWIGWMSNWQYAKQVPTDPFRGAMSIPRKLTLRKEEGELKLIQLPIDFASIVASEAITMESFTLQPDKPEKIEINNLQMLFQGKVKGNTASAFTWTIRGENEYLQIIFDGVNKEVRIDRTQSGLTTFSEQFPSVSKMPLKELEEFSIFIDQSSVELFVNQGSGVMTELFFPTAKKMVLEIEAIDGIVDLGDISLKNLQSSWK
ncbi:glycoside hydrolase family 32 protein [Niallia sp. NCCP-28]|uniref:glycoside hydrolase family 32 protein n=1 Tax=Niallia sp. NCCP-28 TaxID=2934712 RepID=UPI00208D3A23|nr:glycoside hydrolase family 32 protein [Niallia sp. NCCP-28]GKU82134.1 hypothetical protein NCCP28_15300 [Niallia sp. NCCP-28]